MRHPLTTTPGPVIKIRGLEANRSYKFVVYAALDMNYNGVNDLLESGDNEEWKQKYGKLSMAEAYAAAQQDGVSLFDTNENFRKYFMLNEKIDTTPDEDGFKFGSINLRKNPDNEDLMQVVYRNSSGLENLEKIVVSVIHASGDPASGVVTLSAQDLFTGEALMTYDSGDQRYILSIPKEIIALTKTGDYQVTLRHYADGKIVQSYSNIYEK